jgi:hypothetical protein
MTTTRKKCIRLAALAYIALSTIGACAAQSFNIDLEIEAGSAAVGAGPPSSSFGAASGSVGFWNPVNGGGPTIPVNLRDLDGNLTQVQMSASGGTGSYGGFNNSLISGDYRLLMGDFADIGLPVTYRFTGLLPGAYRVFTYAVDPASTVPRDVTVSLPGASVVDLHVNGMLTGNVFSEGITHSVHDLVLTGTNFDITVSGPEHHTRCNGFQIVAVPEPTAVVTVVGGILVLLKGVRF